MAQKRMFDKSIIETDRFLNISLGAKALYFLLGMEADDEGFVSPTRVLRLYGGEAGDLKNLIDTGLVIRFNSGVIVITDWHENNYLDKNRIKPTQYKDEKKSLAVVSRKYVMFNECLTGVQPGEDRGGEERTEEERVEYIYNTKKNKKFIEPSVSDIKAYCTERANGVDPQKFHDFYTSKGWMVGKNKMKDWKAAVRTWEPNNKPKEKHIVDIIRDYIGRDKEGLFNVSRYFFKDYNLAIIMGDIHDFEGEQEELYQKQTVQFLQDKESINYLKNHPYVANV